MEFLLSSVFAASAAFIATNIDDIFLLMIFFSQEGFQKRHIILGQYLGFGLLVILSSLGFLGAMIIPKEWIGLLGILPIYMGIRQLLSKDKDDDEPAKLEVNEQKTGFLTSLISPQTYAVALVTFANGGDNISVYIPLFASQSLAGYIITLVVFAILIAVLLYLGYRLGEQSFIRASIERYGHIIVPLVLIALGIFILLESDSLCLFAGFFAAQ